MFLSESVRRSASHSRAHARGRRAHSVRSALSSLSLTSHATSCLLAAEEIEAVDDVEHGVAVDGVVLDVAATHCRYRSGEVII